MKTELEYLKELVSANLAACNDQDAESIIWYGRFLNMISFAEHEYGQDLLFQQLAE